MELLNAAQKYLIDKLNTKTPNACQKLYHTAILINIQRVSSLHEIQ